MLNRRDFIKCSIGVFIMGCSPTDILIRYIKKNLTKKEYSRNKNRIASASYTIFRKKSI